MKKRKVAFGPSIKRLPMYLGILRQETYRDRKYISGTVIARDLNLEPIQVRKDLAITGISGIPKKGYPIRELKLAIEKYLGWDVKHKSVVIGAGNLGSALSGYTEFKQNSLEVLAVFDNDTEKTGILKNGIPVLPLENMHDFIRDNEIEIAILTVPQKAAQDVTDCLVKGGIKAIWNFTRQKLDIPSHIVVHREDLSAGFAYLSVMYRHQMEKQEQFIDNMHY